MTELQFLVELLVNHKLPTKTKQFVVDQIKEVEARGPSQPRPQINQSYQAPSTQRILEQAGMTEAVQPTTPQAAQALADRNAAIMKAVKADPFGGKPEPGRTSPRKF